MLSPHNPRLLLAPVGFKYQFDAVEDAQIVRAVVARHSHRDAWHSNVEISSNPTSNIKYLVWSSSATPSLRNLASSSSSRAFSLSSAFATFASKSSPPVSSETRASCSFFCAASS